MNDRYEKDEHLCNIDTPYQEKIWIISNYLNIKKIYLSTNVLLTMELGHDETIIN